MKIAVIIPTYNAGKYIKSCLESIKKQTFLDYEIIIVDDCSDDNTYEIASQYGRVLRLDKRSGAGAARNAGAKLAQAEILAFTDADCIVPERWLEKINQNFRDAGIGAAGGGYLGDLSGSFMGNFADLELKFRRKKISGFVRTLVSNNLACRRDVFGEIGGFPAMFRGATAEDLIFSYLISKKYLMKWDGENGIYHNFSRSLSRYMAQQYGFGRDTVIGYYMYPDILKVKTYQGRKIYTDLLLGWALLASPFFSLNFFPVIIALVLINNIGFLNYLRKEKGIYFAVRSFAVIILRNTVWAVSTLFGALNIISLFMRSVKKWR